MVSGEIGVVGNGKAAANDASFDGPKATAAKNPNSTSALTDSESGTLVERNVLESSPKVINQAEPEILAKVNNGRSPYSEFNGAIGDARGWSQALDRDKHRFPDLEKHPYQVRTTLRMIHHRDLLSSGTPNIVLLAEAI